NQIAQGLPLPLAGAGWGEGTANTGVSRPPRPSPAGAGEGAPRTERFGSRTEKSDRLRRGREPLGTRVSWPQREKRRGRLCALGERDEIVEADGFLEHRHAQVGGDEERAARDDRDAHVAGEQ